MLRYVPERMLGRVGKSGRYAYQAVRLVEAVPPALRTGKDSLIIANSVTDESGTVWPLTLVKVTLESGSVRHFGTRTAFIDGSLRMAIEVDPKNEVLRNWELLA